MCQTAKISNCRPRNDEKGRTEIFLKLFFEKNILKSLFNMVSQLILDQKLSHFECGGRAKWPRALPNLLTSSSMSDQLYSSQVYVPRKTYGRSFPILRPSAPARRLTNRRTYLRPFKSRPTSPSSRNFFLTELF